MGTDNSGMAFSGERCLAFGPMKTVIEKVIAEVARDPEASILIFDSESGRVVDLDLRGTHAKHLTDTAAADEKTRAAKPHGRPKLGVVPREVTLLPRHWEWLGEQPGGASAAIRRLVEVARSANTSKDSRRRATEAADRFMQTMAGNLTGYEDASRALYAGQESAFVTLTDEWPADIRAHVRRLAHQVFAVQPIPRQS